MHALRGWRAHRRLVTAVALTMALLLVVLVAVQAVAGGTAHAATALLCDQKTVYGVNANKQLVSLDVSGDAGDIAPTTVATFPNAQNALGMNADGSAAYAFTSAGSTLEKYDPTTNTTTTLTTSAPISSSTSIIRGAVNPKTGIYYYAGGTYTSGSTTATPLFAYDPAQGANGAIGQVATISGLPANKNGDMAFSTSGQLFVVGGNVVVRVDSVPTAAANPVPTLTSTTIATLNPNTLNSPGIAFTTDGYLYLSINSGTNQNPVGNLYKLDPATGATIWQRQLTNYYATDLATCNYPDTVAGQVSVDHRWHADDQFTVTVASTQDSQSTAGTTTGSDEGLQTQKAGAVLTLPGRTYSVTETAAGSRTSLSDYTTSWSCVDANDPDKRVFASGSGASGDFTVPATPTGRTAGTEVVCTVANVMKSVRAGAADDTASTTANTAVSGNVLTNDAGTGLTVTSNTQPTHAAGTITVASDGSYTYTPATDFSGTDTFTYTATDGSGASSTATVTVTVVPTAADDTISTTPGKPGTVTVTANDHGSALSASVSQQPAHGSVTIDQAGVATYTPSSATFSGSDSFTYTVTDASGQTATATVRVTVSPQSSDDQYSTPAETTLRVAAPGVLANDAGSDLTVSANTDPAKGGTVTVDPDGSFVYTPKAGFSGDDTFQYTAKDGSGTTTKSTVTITVTPTAGADTISTTAGTPGTVDVTANDHGSSLTAAVTQQPSNGSATIDGNGIATYTPADGTSGKDSFTYTVTDSSGNTASATVTVTVVPKAADDTLATTAGEPGTSSLLDNDQGTGLSVAGVTQPAHGSVTVDPGTGVATYTPSDPTYSGADSFTYTVTDGTSTSAPATVTVTIGPKAVDDTATTSANKPLTSAAPGVLGNDQGNGLTVTKNTDPTAQGGSATVNPDGSYTYTPPTDFSGTDSFTYTVKGDGGSATATVSVTVEPTAGDDSITTAAGTPGTVNVLGDSHGSGLVPTVATQPANGTVTIASDGTATYTPKPDTSGPDSFTYTVTDASGQTATGTVSVTVEPTAANDRIQSLAGQPGSADLLANDHGSALTITSHTDPDHGTLTIAPDGTATFTPDAGWSGNTTFTYTVTDGSQQTATATAYITVGVVTAADAYSTKADTTLSVDPRGVLTNDQGDQLTATAVAGRGPQHGNVTVNGDGSFTYVPTDGFSGTDTFQYTATDADGVHARGTVTITVTPWIEPTTVSDQAGSPQGGTVTAHGSGTTITVSTPPAHGTVTLGDDGTYTYTPTPGYSGDDSFQLTVTDGSGQQSTTTVPVTVLPTAVDDAYGTPANTKLVVAAPGVRSNDHGTGTTVTGYTAPAHGTVSIATDGAFVYQPTAGYSGPDAFTYTITDQAGRTATATVTVAVGIVTAPDAATTSADTAVTVDAAHGVLANDGGSALTAAKASDPAHGTVTVRPDGSYTYTPTAGYSGPDTFTYTATDRNGTTKTDRVTVTVLPKAADDAYRTPTGHALDVVAADGVLVNDDGSGIRVTAVGTPAHGTATIAADGTVHYVPVTGYSGTDTFPYTITDASGGTATATVTVSVRPWAAPDTQATASDTPLVTTRATGVLANDLGTGLRVTDHTTPAHGTLQLAADGSCTYVPTNGFSGTDTYTYTITDQAGQTATTTVVIVVGPMATADSGTTPAGTTLTVRAPGGVLSNDVGTGLTATIDLRPSHGTVVLGSDGSYTYTPADGYSGTDVFTYTATDGSGQTATGVVTITVTPKAVDDVYRTPADTAVTRSVSTGPLSNDDGRRLRVVAVGTPHHGTATLGATGAFVYTPTKGFSGKDAFTYTIEDVAGHRATATITVTVLPAAKDDRYTVIAGQPLRISPSKGILGDDTGTGLWAQIASQPAHGTVTVAADGAFVYTPDAGFHGADSFTYTTTDAAGNSATATVFLTVATPATAEDDSAHGKPGKPTTVEVLANDTPTSGATFDRGSLTLVDPTTHGTGATVTVQGQGDWAVQDGTVVFTPAPGFSGTAKITYRVTDSAGVTVQAVVTVDYPTPAQVTARALAYTGGASLGWLALVAAGVVLVGAVLRRRRGDAEPGPRRTGE